jgi:biotin carboxylase
VALEEFDVITAGLIREHLQVPGMTGTTARRFRDKLAMRVHACADGVPVPDFTPLLNEDDLRHFLARVPPPWVLKPRSDVSAIGIRTMHDAPAVWRAIEDLDARASLRERPSYYLLERFIRGDVFHVDSVVDHGTVVFAGVNRYRRPPMEVAHHGGVFVTSSLEHGSADERALIDLNARVLASLGLERGASHAEFIRDAEDGGFHFLEVAARVGGAYIAETLEAATGLNLWREWARVELHSPEQPYDPPHIQAHSAGLVLSLARQEWPDTSGYTDPEIVYRVRRPWHAGLIVASPSHARVQDLLDRYQQRFLQEFCAVLPPRERVE